MLRRFPTQREADKWAAGFAYARAFNQLPALIVEPDGDEWTVINPDVDAEPQPGRRVRTPVTA